MLKNKKAISDVVVTILIVLISIVAVAVLWAVLGPMLRGTTQQLPGKQDCILLSLSIVPGSASYDDLTSYAYVTVKRGADGAKLDKIRILVDGKTATLEDDTAPDELGEVEYTITDVGGELLTGTPAKIEIAGIIQGNVLCNVADTVEGDEITEIPLPTPLPTAP